MELFMMWGWVISPTVGCGADSVFESQQISDGPVGMGFPHSTGRYPPGGCRFSSPGCFISICAEMFPI